MILKKYSLYIVTLLVFSGCFPLTEKIIDKKPLKIHTAKKIEKKPNYCIEYEKNMKYSSSYIFKEFKEGYFNSNDFTGAKAQLFLIKNKSESIFAQNINSAEQFYQSNYKVAKKKKCNVEKYRIFPLKQIETQIEKMDKSSVKTTLQ
jgi:hypothetical protein